MRELFDGVFHWTARNENIGADVSSYFVVPSGVIIDPMLGADGIDGLRALGEPRMVVLTIGHHTRDAQAVAEASGIPIVVSREGAERIGDALDVQTHGDGDELAPGVRAIKVGAIAEDEYSLHLTATEPALTFADGLINYGSPGFVPDELLGDDPEAVKAGLTQRYLELADELTFEHLLFAHGEPVVGGGRQALRDAFK